MENDVTANKTQLQSNYSILEIKRDQNWVLFAVASFSKTAGGLFLNRFYYYYFAIKLEFSLLFIVVEKERALRTTSDRKKRTNKTPQRKRALVRLHANIIIRALGLIIIILLGDFK